jgi:hypothetical protein
MLPFKRAVDLAADLHLNVFDMEICFACLGIVAIALESGDEPRIRGATVAMTPDLWHEGLEAPVRAALVRAAAEGVKDARQALDDIAARGPRTTIARAAVRRLAYQLVCSARAARN